MTELDIKKIDQYRRFHTCEEHQYGEYCEVQDILQLYEENKQTLYKMLGNQFILEKSIICEKSQQEMRRIFAQATSGNDGKLRPFISYFRASIEKIWNETMGIAKKDINDANEPFVSLYYSLLSDENLRDNKVVYLSTLPLRFVSPKTGTVITIDKDMKLMKAVQKVVDAYGLDQQRFEDFRIAHSQILNDKQLKGTLCLSIHPLDYMTMSDNKCDWSSCMSWRDTGCYRKGTVEMMNSPIVIIAYLKSDKDMDLFGRYAYVDDEAKTYTWNNKKWRELFIVHENVITGIKAYPYMSRNLEEQVLDWLKELAKNNLNREYSDNKYTMTYAHDVVIQEDDPNPACGLTTDRKFHFCFNTYNMYNDFGCTPDGKHMALYNISNIEDKEFAKTIRYSAYATCMCCGETYSTEGCEAYLLCEDCGRSTVTCDCCGWRGPEDSFHWVDGECICQSCYEDETFYDYITEEDRWNDNSIELKLSMVPDRYVTTVNELTPEERIIWDQVCAEKTCEWGEINDFSYIQMMTVHRVWELYPILWSNFFRCPSPHYNSNEGEYWVSVADMTSRYAQLRDAFCLYSINAERLIRFNELLSQQNKDN